MAREMVVGSRRCISTAGGILGRKLFGKRGNDPHLSGGTHALPHTRDLRNGTAKPWKARALALSSPNSSTITSKLRRSLLALARDRGIRWRNNCGIKCRCRYSLSGLQLAMDPEREPTNLGMMLWRKTLACLEEHMLEASDTTAPIDAIRAAARGHLRAERIAAYWAECGSNWTKSRPDRYPTFKEWLQQADAFVAST